MLVYLTFFKKKGILHYTGEDSLQTADELSGVYKRLDPVKALTYKNVHNIGEGLAICNTNMFRNIFKLLAESAGLGKAKIL